MVRLTADLILRSPQYFNAVRERELDLRGNKIGVIENLGATEDQYASIDLSDNEIVKLEGFPHLKRLTTLLVNNNRIARINPIIGAALPKLETLVLTNNRLSNLVDLDHLATLVNLQNLCLLDNAVTKRSNYRLYLIHKLPKLRLLDFKKVKLKERQEAKKYFATENGQHVKAPPSPAKTFTPGEIPVEDVPETVPVPVEEPSRKGPTPEQIIAIKTAIANSQTLEEVARLEKALKQGQLPSDIVLPGDDTSKVPTTDTDMGVPANTQQPEGTTAMEEG
jgi:U2 small nuclear ribonucleoprotein A'